MKDFLYLMQQVLYFVNYKWNIWGFSFSIMDSWYYIALANLALAFVWQIFGQIPNALHGSSEMNYNNSGKAGSHHYGNRKQ